MSLLSEEYAGLISRVKGYKPSIPTERFSDIPRGYETKPGGTEYNVDPSPLAKFRNLPEFMGGGQYVLDPDQKASLVKSVRKYDPIRKNKLMGGLSSNFFQIDHKVPLWAGGTDTDANKERLTIPDHIHKTKVGTVARTLYYNDKLNLSGARTMLLGWKDKDISDIELTDKGELSESSTEALSKAIFLEQEWKKPKKIKVGWKDVWSEMKKNPIIRGTQSAISAFTAGLYKPDYAPVEKGKELETTVTDVAGNIAGTIASFAAIQGFVVQGARLIGIKNLFGGVQSYKSAISAGKTFRDVGKVKVSPPIGMKMVQNIVPFTIHGQLAKTFEGEEFRYDGDRVHRFLSDAAFGSIVGLAGNTLKSYAGLGAGVYGLGIIEGATPKEALMSSAIMVGFHGLGHKGRSKLIQDAATRESVRYLMKDSRIKIFPEKINPETKKPFKQEEILDMYVSGSLKFTEKEANRIGADAFKNLRQDIKNVPEGYTPEIINKKSSEILTATRQLYKSTLGVEARMLEDVRDMKSLVKRESVNKKTSQDMPDKQYNLLLKELPKIKNFEKGNISKTEAEFLKKNKLDLPIGTTPVTGTLINKENIITAMDDGMKAGSKVIISTRKDLVNFSKELNKSAEHWTEMIGNPNHFLEVYYPGANKFIRTGVLASENRILHREHSLIPSAYTEKDFNPKMNKDNIGKAMDKTNVDYLVAEVGHVSISKKGNPSMTIRILPESYSISKAKVGEKQLPKMLKEGKSIYDLTVGKDTFYSRLSEENKIKLKSWSLIGKEKASDIISAKDMSTGYKHLSSVMFKPLEKALVTKDIKKIQDAFKETVGLNVPKEVASKFASDKKLNVGKIIETIEGAKKRMKVEKDVVKIQEVKSKVEKVEKEKVMKAVKMKEIKEKKEIVTEAVNKTDEGLIQDVKINKKKEVEIINNKIETEKDKYVNRNEKFEDDVAIEAIKAVEPEKITIETISKKSPKDLDVYGKVQNNKVIKIFADVINSSIKKAREIGNTLKINKLLDYSKTKDKDSVAVFAKKIYKDSGNNLEVSFEKFKNTLKNEYDKFDSVNNPFLTKKYDSMLRKYYSKAIDSDSYKELVFKNGKFKTEITKTPQPSSFFGDEGVIFNKKYNKGIKEFVKENPKAVISDKHEIFYFNNKLSTFTKKQKKDKYGNVKEVEKNDKEKLTEMEKEMDKIGSNYVVIGLTDKKINNLAFVKRNDFLIEKFNKNPQKYLAKDESPLHFGNGEKQLKVMGIEIMGFDKETFAGKIMKRLKLVDARDQKVKLNAKVKHFVLESPTLQKYMEREYMTLYGKKFNLKKEIETNYFPTFRKKGESFEAWKKTSEGKKLYDGVVAGYQKSAFDGIGYLSRPIIDTFTKATGMGIGRKQIKPTVAKKINEQLILMKTSTSVHDPAHLKYFEILAKGQKIGKNDAVTFYDNIKEGKQIVSIAKGDSVGSLVLPADSYRLKFSEKHGETKGSFSSYRLSNIPTDKKIEPAMKEYYKPKINKIKDIVEMAESGTKLKDIFKKYEISVEGMTPQDVLKIKHGSDILSGNKQMQGVVKNLIMKDIVKGVTKEGRHLTIVPALPGRIPEGKIGVEHSSWINAGKPKQMLVVRDPSNGHGSMLICDIVTTGKGSKNRDITNLGNEQSMMHPKDVIMKLNGDFDGDSCHSFFIGNKSGQIPKVLAEKLVVEQKKTGALFPEEPLKPKVDVPDHLNKKNLEGSSRNTLLAGEGIGITASQVRTLYTLESAGTTIKTTVKNGYETSILYTGKGTKKSQLLTSGKPVKSSRKDGIYETEFKYTDQKIQEALTMSQRTVDAQTDNTLRLSMGGNFDGKVLLSSLVGKSPSKNEISLFAKRINELQDVHQLKKAKDYNEMYKKIEKGNRKIKQIEFHGGEVGLIYKLNQWLGTLPKMIYTTGGDVKAKRIQHEMRMAGKENVEKELSHKFLPVGTGYEGNINFVKNVTENQNINMKKVIVFIERLRNVNRQYLNINKGRIIDKKTGKIKFTEHSREKRTELKREARKKMDEYWEENGYKLNQGEKDAFAYYLATAEDANYGSTAANYLMNNKKRMSFFSKPEGIMNEASESISKAFYTGIRTMDRDLKKRIFSEESF